MFELSNFENLWQEGERKAQLSSPHYSQTLLVKANVEAIREKPFSESLKQFLVHSGLPESAAPFLTFEEVNENAPQIFEIFGPAETWQEVHKQRLIQYFVIGMDGAGNPICVDTENGERIVLLDHEDYFVSIQFVNSSISQLCNSLLAYREQYISKATHKEVMDNLKNIDAVALQNNSFWFYAMVDDEDWGSQTED